MTTTQKFELRPTSGSPEFKPGQPHDPEFCDTDCVECLAAVGWDLSFGSRINFGPDADGNLTVSLHLSDDALANAMVYRTVTDVQVIGFARHLLTLTKGDDDIETIAAKLAETAAQFNQRIEEKAEALAAPRIAEVERTAEQELAEARDLHAHQRQRWTDLEAEFRRQLDVQWRMNDQLRAELAQVKADLARAEGTR